MNSNPRRVVVTGLGVTSALGVGRSSLIDALASGQSALGPFEGALDGVPPGQGGILDLPRREFRNYFDTKLLRLSTMTRQTTLGCIGCGALLTDGGIEVDEGGHPDRGAYLGSFIIPPDYGKQVRAMQGLARRSSEAREGFVLDDTELAQAMKAASAFDFLRALPNMPSSHLSIQTGAQGPTCTYLGADASGLQALIMAAGAISDGLATTMIAGGAFSPFQEVHLAWQQTRGLWSEDWQLRPYSDSGTGTLPGEGAALFLLEERDHAEKRGASILAEVTGWAQRVELAGDARGSDARREALEAACPEGRADWIAPAGLGHADLDRLEAEAYEGCLGDQLDQAAAVTLTPQAGFSGPACGPLNLAAALLSARGEAQPHRSSLGDGGSDARGRMGAAFGRSAATGAGATVLGSLFSLDGLHAAVSLRVEG